MSPERRALIVEALIAIWGELFAPYQTTEFALGLIQKRIEALTDAELTVKVANIEALLERAQQTDV